MGFRMRAPRLTCSICRCSSCLSRSLCRPLIRRFSERFASDAAYLRSMSDRILTHCPRAWVHNCVGGMSANKV